MMSGNYLRTAIEIARDAGVMLTERFGAGVRHEAKGAFDLVTDADTAVETVVLHRIRAAFPSHTVVAEEGGSYAGTSELHRWFVDPLDGTKNFARGYPAFSISLALERAGELVAGVVFDPVRNEMFAADQGGGAFLNDRRIRVSPTKRMADSLVTTGYPSAARHGQGRVPPLHEVVRLTQGLRRTGSSALDLSYVACGRLDALWDVGLRSWDIAAGLVLLAEAGGRYSDLHGAPFDFVRSGLLATNGFVHDAFVEAFGAVAAVP
jgi:myo-inositol-1(or 4)-monophosphatase